jgi:flagellar hook-associated protein 2
MTTTSATSSATSQLITSLGAGSGINMAELAGNLATAQFAARQDRLTARSETLDRQISTASNLRSMISSLAASLGDRVRVGDLSPQPRLANTAVAQVSLTGATTPKGTYSLEVTALAKAQTLASPAYAAATSAVGSGSLTLRFGTVSGSGFTPDAARSPVSVTIASGATLADVASAINGANAGVSAYVANTVAGAQLVLKGQDGSANGFVLEATETVGEEGLANLAWTPAGDATRLKSTASDATFSIDGLAMTAKGNSVSDAIPGLRFQFTGTNTGAPTQLSFADPGAAITEAMTDLTAALNEIMSELRAATDPLTGDLARDSGARALRQEFAALAGRLVMPTAPAGTPRTLADLGLATQRDGSFLLDKTRLAATLKADPQGAAAMFTNGLFGVYATVDGMARKAAKSSDPGTLAGSIARYSKQKATISSDLSTIAEKQEALRAQLVKRFAATDTQVGYSKSTLSFLQGQIDAWNAQRN